MNELSPTSLPTAPPTPLMATLPLPAPIPSPRRQSWGALIALVVIVLMIVTGAFYAWGQRIAQNGGYPPSSSAALTPSS